MERTYIEVDRCIQEAISGKIVPLMDNLYLVSSVVGLQQDLIPEHGVCPAPFFIIGSGISKPIQNRQDLAKFCGWHNFFADQSLLIDEFKDFNPRDE